MVLASILKTTVKPKIQGNENMNIVMKICLMSALTCCCSSLLAQKVTFELIPGASSANDMTSDGRFVVGNLDGTSEFSPYRYDTVTGDMLILPGSEINASAIAVSDDGTIIVGNIDEDGPGGNQSTAGIWREQTNEWVSLGFFKSAAAACGSLSSAYELSADGTIATGLGWVDGCNARAFRWTEGTGLQAMDMVTPSPPGGDRASVISADGSLMAGFAQGSFSRTPAIWNGDTLTGELLDPPNGDALGEIHGISDDGSILLGNWDGDASKWTFDGSNWVREIIGNGSVASSYAGIPTDIADDGTIVGFEINTGFRRSFIQYQGKGDLQLLRNWAIARGAEIPSDIGVQVCQAISTDGTKMIGHNAFPFVAFIFRVESGVLVGDVNLDGMVNLLDVDPFVNLLTTGDFQEEADINQDGEVNLLDVDPFVALLSGG